MKTNNRHNPTFSQLEILRRWGLFILGGKKAFISIVIMLLLSIHSNTTAGWTEMYSGTTISLRDIWGSSSSNLFVVGYSTDDDTGIILHYGGSAWSTMESGIVSRLWGVWGNSGSDVFAVGDNGVIIHYDGSAWSTMESGTVSPLLEIWGSSGSDVFAVGSNGTILHYDGSTWSFMESGTTLGLIDVWGSSGSDVFAVGHSVSSDTILHYDGTNWSAMTGPTPIEEGYLYGVWGSSATDVYAVGFYWDILAIGRILHYDGLEWSEVRRNPDGPHDSFYRGVWGSSATNVIVVGDIMSLFDYSIFGTIINYDGTNWSQMYIDSTTLNSVWGFSSSDVYTVGYGRIYRYDGIPDDEDNCPTDYNPLQEDTYPPQGNGIGDACECESDFNCDGNVDADDVTEFLNHFGRSQYSRPCTNGDPCSGDTACDADVDADDVTKFLEDFGRSKYFNPCPACVVGNWCVYP